MQTEAPRGPELRGHRSAPSYDLARVAGCTPCDGGRRGCAFYVAWVPGPAPERASRAGRTGFSRPAGRAAGRPEAPGPAPRARAGVALTHRPRPAPSLAHLVGVDAGAAPAGTRSVGFAKLTKGPRWHSTHLAPRGARGRDRTRPHRELASKRTPWEGKEGTKRK